MRPPSPTWETDYKHDRRKRRHKCRCCGVCLETGDRALMVKVGAFTRRRYTTWALHLSCADKGFSNPPDATNVAGWTWRDAFIAWGTEHLRRVGYTIPQHPMSRVGAIKQGEEHAAS